jgi:hypothetical protein
VVDVAQDAGDENPDDSDRERERVLPGVSDDAYRPVEAEAARLDVSATVNRDRRDESEREKEEPCKPIHARNVARSSPGPVSGNDA